MDAFLPMLALFPLPGPLRRSAQQRLLCPFVVSIHEPLAGHGHFPPSTPLVGSLMTIQGQGLVRGGDSEAIFLDRGSSKLCLDTSNPGHSMTLEAGELSLMENDLIFGETVLTGSQNSSSCDRLM